MRQLCFALLILFLLASCRDKVICPTFQSTYILDDSVRSTYFSYLWYLNETDRKNYLAASSKIPPPDSLGVLVASSDGAAGIDYFAYTAEYKVPQRETKRTKYGIAKRTPVIPNLIRNLQLKTSPMENVLTPPEIVNEETPKASPADSSAYKPLDSTAAVVQQDTLNVKKADSTAVTKNVEKKKQAPYVPFKYAFNPLDSMQPDQEYYFRKYGWLLQNARPKEEVEDPVDSIGNKKRKGLWGLFKKKDKTPKEPKVKKVREKKAKVADEPINDEATKEEEVDEGFD